MVSLQPFGEAGQQLGVSMAYSVDWSTKIITIPQSDLVAVSAGVYELDVLVFWSEIHDIQDGEGMTYDTIMASNAPVTISGATYARTVQVINGYRIQFEDGQYQVNLTGANNNILDARVQNQVSLNSSNSAGLVVADGGSGSGLYDLTDRSKLNRIDAVTQIISANNP